MCILLVSYKTHPNYQMVIAANRDEFYDRPTARASFWEDYPGLLAGKDLQAGGTWLGISRTGRFSAVTNYRSAAKRKEGTLSRGKLVLDFLAGKDEPEDYAAALIKKDHLYDGFNLIFSNLSDLYYYSNQNRKVVTLPPGIYGLSNHLLDTPWTKVEKSKLLFNKALVKMEISVSDLFEILSDASRPSDELLPDTGVGLEFERALSSVFVSTPVYGTVSSTVVFVSRANEVRFIEKSMITGSKEWITSEFSFTLE